MTALLEVRNLRIGFPSAGGAVWPVDGVSLAIGRGELLALVGESGSGKSLTCLGILRLVPPPGSIGSGGHLRLEGQDLLGLDAEAMRAVRGRRIGMVFQDPMTALNPVLTVGYQLEETLKVLHGAAGLEARQRAAALLDEVGLPDPVQRLGSYAHELSGGQRQRVLLALALAGDPDLLLADEPTSALDVTIQAQILQLLDTLRARRGLAVLLVTHDLGIVAGRADRVAVMYAGRIVEEAAAAALYARPAHPYSRGLLRSTPRLDHPVARLEPIGGSVPSPASWPPGCRFHPRCGEALAACSRDVPHPIEVGSGHRAACWLHADRGRSP